MRDNPLWPEPPRERETLPGSHLHGRRDRPTSLWSLSPLPSAYRRNDRQGVVPRGQGPLPGMWTPLVDSARKAHHVERHQFRYCPA